MREVEQVSARARCGTRAGTPRTSGSRGLAAGDALQSWCYDDKSQHGAAVADNHWRSIWKVELTADADDDESFIGDLIGAHHTMTHGAWERKPPLAANNRASKDDNYGIKVDMVAADGTKYFELLQQSGASS